jgi:ribosomal protein S18 acetylase RimI-like enzyme
MDTGAFTLRFGVPQDARLIREFVRATYAKWVPVMGREPMPMTADYDLALQKHRFVLAMTGDTLAGLIETVREADHLWVENIAVRSDLQGRGLGQRLLGLAEAQAREAGLPQVRLLTNAALVSNIRFYQAYGFAITETEPFRGGFVVWFAKGV